MRKLALATVLLALTVVGAWTQDDHATPNSAGENSSTVGTAPNDEKVSVAMSTVSALPGYVIGLDDVLHIAVWKEPDLTTTLPVRSDGMISLPLLNDVQAAGLTPMQLAALLSQKLKKYVASPNVTVVVTQANSRRIYVFGEVSHTGPIALLHDMTVMQALSTVGFTQFANTKRIYILRMENGQEKKIPFNYKQAIKGDAAALNVLLQPGDMIVVP
jgi:polysaccharide export outer membrane protein